MDAANYVRNVLTIGIDHGKKKITNTLGQGMLMLETVTISKFKATCLRLLSDVKRTGRPLLVTRKGEPIALITPPPPPKPKLWLGSLRDTVKIRGDIISPAVDEKDWEVLKD
jgi:antitoxin (DNA-binding transcriptional repressor) of toxin-antitoxin stability system